MKFSIENIRNRLAFKKRNRNEFACDLSHIAIIQLLQQIIVFIQCLIINKVELLFLICVFSLDKFPSEV